MKIRFFLSILFASLFISLVSAETIDPATLLNSALADMECRVTFEVNFINEITSIFPSLSLSLSPKVAVIQADLSQLSNYASQGDKQNYKLYVQETFSQHLKQDSIEIKAGLEGIKSSITRETKNATKASFQNLKSAHQSLMETLNACSDSNNHTGLMIQYYTDTLNRYEKKAQNLTDKGIDASNLFNLVNSARAEILIPLQDEISQANNNASEIRAAFNHYCLYDGCANGINFHMAVNFETIRMTELFAAISPKAIEAGLDSDVALVQALLDAVIAKVNLLGKSDVSAYNLKAIWVDIRAAAKEIKDLFTALKGDINE